VASVIVRSIQLQVSSAKEPYKRDYILQKRRIIWRSLLIVATPWYIVRRSKCNKLLYPWIIIYHLHVSLISTCDTMMYLYITHDDSCINDKQKFTYNIIYTCITIQGLVRSMPQQVQQMMASLHDVDQYLPAALIQVQRERGRVFFVFVCVCLTFVCYTTSTSIWLLRAYRQRERGIVFFCVYACVCMWVCVTRRRPVSVRCAPTGREWEGVCSFVEWEGVCSFVYMRFVCVCVCVCYTTFTSICQLRSYS